MNKIFRVYFEDDKGNYWHDLPTFEEARERVIELSDEGYTVKTKIEEIRV